MFFPMLWIFHIYTAKNIARVKNSDAKGKWHALWDTVLACDLNIPHYTAKNIRLVNNTVVMWGVSDMLYEKIFLLVIWIFHFWTVSNSSLRWVVLRVACPFRNFNGVTRSPIIRCIIKHKFYYIWYILNYIFKYCQLTKVWRVREYQRVASISSFLHKDIITSALNFHVLTAKKIQYAQHAKNISTFPKHFVCSLCKQMYLKGQSHEIFDPWFFSLNITPESPDSWAKAVLNIDLNSRSNSIRFFQIMPNLKFYFTAMG
jgi:hypothetical protein